MRLTFTPGAGSISKVVITGPGRTATTLPSMPKSASLALEDLRALAQRLLVDLHIGVRFGAASIRVGGIWYRSSPNGNSSCTRTGLRLATADLRSHRPRATMIGAAAVTGISRSFGFPGAERPLREPRAPIPLPRRDSLTTPSLTSARGAAGESAHRYAGGEDERQQRSRRRR